MSFTDRYLGACACVLLKQAFKASTLHVRTHARTRAHTHTRTHARTHARTRARTHTHRYTSARAREYAQTLRKGNRQTEAWFCCSKMDTGKGKSSNTQQPRSFGWNEKHRFFTELITGAWTCRRGKGRQHQRCAVSY